MMNVSRTTIPGRGPRLQPDDIQRSSESDSALGYNRETLHTTAQKIREHLEPYDERGELVLSLFRKLSLGSVSCHTIFGTKPVSEHCIGLSDRFCGSNPTSVTREELSAWQQIAQKASLVSSFLILREGEKLSADLDGASLLIYNVHNIRETFARHSDRFREKLGPSTTAASVIELVHKTPDLNSLFDGDHELKGILVGYGRKSAATFARIVELTQQAKIHLPGPHTNLNEHLALSDLPPDFPREEFINLHQSLQPAIQSTSAISVGFRVHSEDHESHELLKGYDATTEALKKLAGEQIVPHLALARWCGMLS